MIIGNAIYIGGSGGGGGDITVDYVANATGTTCKITGSGLTSPACNKITVNNNAILDVSADTVTPQRVLSGNKAHDSSGTAFTGSYVSNIVTGTFTGTTAGSVHTVSLAYTGTGYPVAFVIYPTEGSYKTDGTFYNLVQQYVIQSFAGTKLDTSVAPTYNSTTAANNNMTTFMTYKSSPSSATSYTRYSTNSTNTMRNTAPTASRGTAVKFYSATEMRVFIASTSYGFATNIPYTYHVIYSQ